MKLIGKLVRRFVRSLANRCDIPLYHPWEAQGRHSLSIANCSGDYKNTIPKSVYFNTGCGDIRIGYNVVFG